MKQEIKNIISEVSNVKNLPNQRIIDNLEKLSTEFEEIKKNLIDLTYQLDAVEENYNKYLKEYNLRNNE
jgi:predicted  nucleic acid-binding Zn-ribbon protein